MKLTSNEKLSIYNGMASSVSINAVNGYIPLFAFGVLGATNQQMGLITSLPSMIGMLALIPGAIWLNRTGSIKHFTLLSTFATRFLFMLIAFIPFMPLDNPAWLLVILIGLLNFPGTLANLSWQTMIGDVVPEERRGDFFSIRNRWSTIIALVVTFGTGFFLEQYNGKQAFPFQILLIFGFLFAILEVFYLWKHDIPSKKPVERISIEKKKLNLAVFKHKPFTAFIACALFFNFGAQMAWSVFSIYHIKEAHATALWFSLFSVTNQFAQIISIRWWAKAANKWGNTFALFIGAAGMATAPLLTVLSTDLFYITGINFWIGIFVSGTNLLLFNQLLKASPDQDRSTYIAAYNFLLSIVGFIAPQFGVLLLDHFGMFSAMGASSLVRLLAGLSFLVVALKLERRIPSRPGLS